MGLFDSLKNVFGLKQDSSQSADPNASRVSVSSRNKVLIVEDEELLANALETKLKNAGFEVVKAQNGKIGLEMATAQKPDLIVCDLLMPVMDGRTMLHNLREIPEFKNLPVVVLTNAGDIDNLRETKTYYNASAFLIKSNVTPDEILKTIKDLI